MVTKKNSSTKSQIFLKALALMKPFFFVEHFWPLRKRNKIDSLFTKEDSPNTYDVTVLGIASIDPLGGG